MLALPARRAAPRAPRRRTRGMALVESLAALTVAGTAAAAAVPHLLAIESAARSAGLQSIAHAAGRAMAHNLAGCLVTEGRPTPGRCLPVHDCAQVGQLLLGGVPEGHSVTPQPIASGSGRIGQAETVCTLRHDASGAVAVFIGLATVEVH